MPRLPVGTQPVQVLRPNPKRAKLEVVFLPGSIVAGNTGLVYGKMGSPPSASLTAETYDFILNPGSDYTLDVADGDSPELVRKELWLTASAASQILTVREDLAPEG